MSSLDQVPDPEVPAKARTRRWSAAEKVRILAEYESLGKADRGVLAAAYTRNPERFVRKRPEPAALPLATWINKPTEQQEPDGPAHSTKP